MNDRHYLPITIEDFKALPETVQNPLIELIAYAIEGMEPKAEQEPKPEPPPALNVQHYTLCDKI